MDTEKEPFAKRLKRVAAVHDLSGFGKSSLTCVIPILSALGIQVCPLPTAVLSTQSDGFDGYAFDDLTDFMDLTIKYWKELGLRFDCIYSGFLGSPDQVHLVRRLVEGCRLPDSLLVVDPVLGDDGSLYDSVHEDMVATMVDLVKMADVITPNVTELGLIMDKEFHRALTMQEWHDELKAVSEMGPSKVVVTSAQLVGKEDEIAVVGYERDTDRTNCFATKKLPCSLPGTGDCFASVLTGCLLKNASLNDAIIKTVDFTTICLRRSLELGYPAREGIQLELALDSLLTTQDKK
ncbi:MAG: pyridoxamine kinase [Lentisphaerae bacterium]|jgi:pyridoxine kinase|nr:pyridoxamine kinase [Lentisphaerota bacterium]